MQINPTTVAACISRLTRLWAGLCCSIRVLGAPRSVPPCKVKGLQAKAQVVGVREATGRLLRGCGEKHPARHCFVRVLEVCSDGEQTEAGEFRAVFFLSEGVFQSVKPHSRSRAALKLLPPQPAVAPQKGGPPYVQDLAPPPPSAPPPSYPACITDWVSM